MTRGRGALRNQTFRNRRGFTLTELMISMVLLTLVIGVVLSLVLSQTRYVSRVSGDVTVLDQIRSSQEVLSYEIADLSRGAITFAGADSIAYRLPIKWGVSCGPIDRFTAQAPPVKKGSPASPIVYSTTVAMQFEQDPDAYGAPAPDGLATSLDGKTFTYYQRPWADFGIVSNSLGGPYCLDAAAGATGKKAKKGKKGAPAKATGVVVASVDDYYVSTALTGVLGDTPDERTLMYAYVNVSYYFKPDGLGGEILYRASKGVTQKLAWPFAAAAGFTYRLDDGTVGAPVVVGNLGRIRAVRSNLPVVRSQRGAARADTINVQPWLYMFNAR